MKYAISHVSEIGIIDAVKWMTISSLLLSRADAINIKHVIRKPIQWMICNNFFIHQNTIFLDTNH